MKKNVLFGVLCCVLILALVGCAGEPEIGQTQPSSTQVPAQATTQAPTTAATEPERELFEVDLTKVSPMILENAEPGVVAAAKSVIEAFLRYETSAAIEVSGNTQRFLNDMAYVIHCTCPLFSAFADLDQMSGYDPETGMVSWAFYAEKDVFESTVSAFYATVEDYLAAVERTDSEAMRAMLLYYGVIEDLNYDYGLIGDAYAALSRKEAALRESAYYVLAEKSGICTNIAQAYLFLCTQAEIPCGTVLHMGGQGMHMWNVVELDGKYYYCDPTWDANGSLKHFGITAADRAAWAGGYSVQEGTMLDVTIPEKYDIADLRFQTLREKLPVEISQVRPDKAMQTITFEGYEYQYTFACGEAAQ